MTTLAPCPTEDSTNCFWDAPNVGNGLGTGFVDINGVLFPLVNEPEWNVSVTAVHYNCDDFTLNECQPYADYANNTIAEVAQPTPAPTPPAQELAATGFDPALLSLAVVLIASGIALKGLFR